MPQQSPYSIALDLLREWEDGKTPALQEYAARFPDAAAEMFDLLADCLILDALAYPNTPCPSPIGG